MGKPVPVVSKQRTDTPTTEATTEPTTSEPTTPEPKPATATATATADTDDQLTSYDASLRHIDIGVWKIFQDVPTTFTSRLEAILGKVSKKGDSATTSPSVPLPLSALLGQLFTLSGFVSICTVLLQATGLPILLRLVGDVYGIAPNLLVLTLMMRFWASLEPLFMLTALNRFLLIIEAGLREGKPDVDAIVQALTIRLVCVAISAVVKGWKLQTELLLQNRVQLHFEELLLRESMRQGAIGNEDSGKELTAAVAWRALESVFEMSTKVFEIACQTAFLFNLSALNGGPTFALCCLVKPIFIISLRPALWSTPYVVACFEKNYRRMKALTKMGTSAHREEVITGNLSDYLVTEFAKLRESLQDKSAEWPEKIWESKRPTGLTVLTSLFEELPLVYYALNAIHHPTRMSITSIAILQQSSAVMRSNVSWIQLSARQFTQAVMDVETLYALQEAPASVKEGTMEYPANAEDKGKGMGFELQDVTFSYPGSKAKKPALSGVTCNIKPGQLVVIVGANGSGKSTVIKLLSRMYDATSGNILLDNQPISSYTLPSFRSCAASLTQEHNLFPLSLEENIGSGYIEEVENTEMIKKAARQTGAMEVVEKFKEGLKTELKPVLAPYGIHVSANQETALGKTLKALGKEVAVSGGEKQRLVAARTFMRFESGRISFVAVDEPSANMDPQAELQLFDNLRACREGKTMVFVTHRFGHLTKYADAILCMKDGSIVESGTHSELMEKKGEYERLYTIQAKAFAVELEQLEVEKSYAVNESEQ